jgi:hypothetical protein
MRLRMVDESMVHKVLSSAASTVYGKQGGFKQRVLAKKRADAPIVQHFHFPVFIDGVSLKTSGINNRKTIHRIAFLPHQTAFGVSFSIDVLNDEVLLSGR